MPATAAAVTGAHARMAAPSPSASPKRAPPWPSAAATPSEGARTVELIEQAGGTGDYTRLDVTDPDAVASWVQATPPTTAACTGSSTTPG